MKQRCLTIAGSDPSGGAGVQQDLKTFQRCGVWGMSAITAITVQNTVSMQRWMPIDAELVRAQIDAVVSDIGVDAVKTGMLPTASIVESVARAVVDHRIERLVVDPVMIATTGGSLMNDEAYDALVKELIPRALLVTPNAPEASRLSGVDVRDRDSQIEAARAIGSLGARAVLVKGGHLPPEGPGESVVRDVLATGDGFQEWVSARADRGQTHGGGCMLSAAITAHLARGETLIGAIGRARSVVAAALAKSERLGGGAIPLDPAAEARLVESDGSERYGR